MKQNYNLLTSSTAFPHAWNTFFQKSKTKTTSLLVVIFTLLGFSNAFAQIAQRGVATTATGNNVSTLTIKKPFVDFV